MGGICGWIGADPARLQGDRDAMLRALAHRRDPVWLDWAGSDTVAIDSAFNPPDEAASIWARWMEDPPAFPAQLEGSFAVAALDRRRGRLVLARDPFGEKPLYYVVTEAGVAFASEIKALLAARAVPLRTLSPEAVDAYLAFTYIPAPRTIFSDVRKVPAGHCLVVDFRMLAAGSAGAVATTRYWKLPDRVGESAGPDRFLAMLSEALGRRMPPAGQVAIYLSGGLDSSLVAALAAREAGSRLISYSIGFPESTLDESAHARRVARLVGCEHREIRLDEVDPALLDSVVRQLDEPMCDAATMPTWALAREAATSRTGARVALTGDGADALLAGDHWFRRLRRLDAMEGLPSIVRQAVPLAAALAGPRRYRRYRDLVARVEEKPPQRYLAIRQKWTWPERMEIYAADFRVRVDPSAAEATYLLAPIDWRRGDSVDAAIRLDTIHGLPEDLLMKADKMGMAHGIESRSPFLDRRFAEWTARLEVGLLLSGSSSKYLLKKSAESLLPRDLVHRRKHGFQVPVGRWMRGTLREPTEAAFSAGLIRRQGIFDGDALGRIKARFDGGANEPAFVGRVWQIMVFQTWWQQVFG